MVCTVVSRSGKLLSVFLDPVLKASLRGLFKSYGEVLDVVAHSNLRMRGQAFVSFADPQVAKKALKEVRGFPLYSKPMASISLFEPRVLY